MKDAKYLAAYLLPLSAALALYWQGTWAWATVLLAFVIIPVAEIFTPESEENVSAEMENSRSNLRFFDALLYLNVPLVFGLMYWYLNVLGTAAPDNFEISGLTLGMGIIVAANGINVAHELGHRTRPFEQFLSKLLLLPALYQHFFIEHNRGHHKYVATDQDPASARFGENVFAFWLRSVTGSWRHAWTIERERLAKEGRPAWSWRNEMLRFTVFQLLWLLVLRLTFGWAGLIAAVAVAVIGFLLLETINYVEHYGLRRRMLPSGRPEPVGPEHSWNSNHELGRIFLYELTRHSDHHFKATRKYQVLRHIDTSPQLPYGYPTSILLALIPPVWFAVMHPRMRSGAYVAA